MYKRIIIIIGLIISLISAKIPLCAMGIATINTQSLNVRSKPGMEGNVISQVRQGEAYTVLAQENGWYLISVNGTEGYISAKYCLYSEVSDNIPGTEEAEPSEEAAGAEEDTNKLVYPLLIGMVLIIAGSILLTIRSIKKEKNTEVQQEIHDDEYYGEEYPEEEEYYGDDYPEEEEYYGDDYPEEEEYYGDEYPEEEEYYGDEYPEEEEYYGDEYPEEEEYYGEEYSGEEEYCEDEYPEEDEYHDEEYPGEDVYYRGKYPSGNEGHYNNSLNGKEQNRKNIEKKEFRKSYNYFEESTEKDRFTSKKEYYSNYDDGGDYRIDVDPSVFED